MHLDFTKSRAVYPQRLYLMARFDQRGRKVLELTGEVLMNE